MKRVFLFALFLIGAIAPVYAQFTFSSIDFPGGALTTAHGINNHGQIVGSYSTIASPFTRHALLISDGNFIPLAPGSVLATHFSEAYKSNDRGDIVGTFAGDDGFVHGFLLSDGVLTTLDFPGASETIAFGINESGTIVGEARQLDASGNFIGEHGFTFKDGTFTQIDFPGAVDTAVVGVNARGDLVGVWDGGRPIGEMVIHGFVKTESEFINFDVPVAGASITQPDDISASGQIVGTYLDADGNEHGFLLDGATFTTIDFPGVPVTIPWAINSAGQIVGIYRTTGGGDPHGFIAQPDNKGKPQ